MFGIDRIQRRFLFPRQWVLPPPRTSEPSGLERWSLPVEGGEVEVWFLPGHGVAEGRPGPLVLFAHGNGELIDHWPAMLAPYRSMGVSVMLPEYRGYGRSAGKPSERALLSDFQKLHARIQGDPRVDRGRLLYHGRSLGGGVVCALAKTHPPSALILESTFTSVVDVARGMGIPSVFITDRFESLPVVSAFPGPVLVMHGTKDTLIPKQHGERLAASNPRAKLVLYDAGHNDLPPAGSDYWQQIQSVLRQLG